MYLSKSDFKVAQTCAAKLYYRKLGYPSVRDDDEYLRFLADGGYMVEAIAKLCFPEGIEIGFEQEPEKSAAETLRLLRECETVTLFEGTLLARQRLARADILRKQGSTLELIEVKAKLVDRQEGANPFRGTRGSISSEWQTYLEDVTFQYSVLRELFPAARVVPYLCLVDKSKTSTVHSLHSKFVLSVDNVAAARFRRPQVQYLGDLDELRANDFLTRIDVSGEVAELLPAVEASSERFVASFRNGISRIQVPINVGCRNCEYRLPVGHGEAEGGKNGFVECWGDLATVTPHILDYYQVSTIGGRNSPVVNAAIAQGRVSLADLEEEQLVRADGTAGPRNVRQRSQREHTLANRECVSDELVQRLRQLPYPLHFIDFETSRVAIPYHAGMRPYEQVAFQWSSHTIRELGAPIEHAEWLNTVDVFPNFDFAAALMKHLGQEGSFLTWSHYENDVLNEIRSQMQRYQYSDPDLADWLNIVPKHDGNDSEFIVDMCELAKVGYFIPKMKGRLSLKYVTPAVWESDDALHDVPEWRKYFRRDSRGLVMNPYETLAPLPFGNAEEENENGHAVTEGIGAMRAYQEMLYGVSRNDEAVKRKWRQLLLQYCELDTAAMVMVWMHWMRSQ